MITIKVLAILTTTMLESHGSHMHDSGGNLVDVFLLFLGKANYIEKLRFVAALPLLGEVPDFKSLLFVQAEALPFMAAFMTDVAARLIAISIKTVKIDRNFISF